MASSLNWVISAESVTSQPLNVCIHQNDDDVFLQVSVPIFVGTVIVVLLTTFLIYRCRVNVFIKFNIHPFNVDECVGEDMAFDAFVCCAGSNDQVARTIVDSLEHSEPGRVGYKVCYHERDFLPGNIITASIQSAIEHSKRVICLMSNEFLRSGMCMLEFHVASNLNIRRRKHRLIVIKWPDLDLDHDIDADNIKDRHSVRLFLSRYTYIEYGVDGWLQRVLYAMPINRLAERHRDNQPARCVEPPTEQTCLLQQSSD